MRDMGEHYYSSDPASVSKPRDITVDALGLSLSFTTDSGVFSKDGLDKGTEALLRAPLLLGGDVLDMCCGWGAIGIAVAAAHPELRVHLRDINRRAVALAQENIRKNHLRNALADEGDGFEGLALFDAILMNPPVRAGKAVVHGLLRDSFAHLRPGGRLYAVIRKAQGAPSAKAYLQELFGKHQVDTVRRQAGFHVLMAIKE